MSTLEEIAEDLAESRRQNQALQQRVQQLILESEHQRRENSDLQRRLESVRLMVNKPSFTLTTLHVRFYNGDLFNYIILKERILIAVIFSF